MTVGMEDIENQSGIYAIIHRESGYKYIGSAINLGNRWRLHLHYLRKNKHHSPRLQRAWNKHSESAFTLVILEVIPREEFSDNAYLTDVEQMWLDAYRPEYNASINATSRLGMKVSPETRAKLSALHKGKKRHPCSEETKEKIRQSQIGKVVPDSVKEKMRGRTVSEETKERLRQFNLGKKQSLEAKLKQIAAQSQRYQLVSPNGEVLVVENLKQFCRDTGLRASHLYSVASGKRGQSQGWKCRKLE